MTVDCRKYSEALSKSLNTIETIWNRYEDKDRAVTEFAVSSGIPIVVVCLFVKEKFPHFESIDNSIKRMISFYGYTKIIHFNGSEFTLP